MERYRCWRCKEVFDEETAATKSELVGDFCGAPAYRQIMICPRCGSQEFDEIEESEDEENDLE